MFRHLYSEKEYVTNNYQKKYNPNSAACVGELTISVFRSLETMKHIDNMILVMCFCENKQTSVRFRTAGLQVLTDRKSTRLNSSHTDISRMPSSA